MSDSQRIETVLFDAAGTLIELRASVGELYADTARAHGVQLPAWRLDDAFRRILANAPPMVFPGVHGAEIAAHERRWWRDVVRSTFLATDGTARFGDFDAFFDELFETFSRGDCWRPRPGCLEMLAELAARGIRCGVVSNFDRRLPALLAQLGIARWLAVVVLPADAGAEKPDPRIFECALERLGASAATSLFVGDSSREDIQGARAAGIRALHVEQLAHLAEFPDRLEFLASQAQESKHV